MLRKLKIIFSLLIFTIIIQCYPQYQNQADPETIYGLLFGYDFSELFGNLPDINLSNQQASIDEGESVEFGIKLSKKPINEKQISITSDHSAISINSKSAETIYFTPQNYNIEQFITLKAEIDENLISEDVNIRLSSNWHSEIILKITNNDKDTQEILASTANENTEIERGSFINYQLSLAKQPEDSITIQPILNQPDLLYFNLDSLIFTPENYQIAQEIRLHALNKLDYLPVSTTIQFKHTDLSVTKSLTIKKNLEYLDISAGQGPKSGYSPSIAMDTIHSKILVTTYNWANDYKLGLFRCDITTDGSDCQHIDISAGQASYAISNPKLVIDQKNQKILVVATNKADSSRLSLYRCNLTTTDGSDCQHIDISAGQSEISGMTPAIALDATNNKILVVTTNWSNSLKPSLFRCNLTTTDGSDCQHFDISAGQGASSGLDPSIIIDKTRNQFFTATTNNSHSSKLSLFRCSLMTTDGTDCQHIDISAGQDSDSGFYPNLVLDSINQKLLIATQNGSNSNKLSLFRCDTTTTDGSDCQHFDISTGQDNDSGQNPVIALDETNKKIIIATRNGANYYKLSLYRCDLNISQPSSCKHQDISAGQGSGSGNSPSINIMNEKIYIAIRNSANYGRPGLYKLTLDYLD